MQSWQCLADSAEGLPILAVEAPVLRRRTCEDEIALTHGDPPTDTTNGLDGGRWAGITIVSLIAVSVSPQS